MRGGRAWNGVLRRKDDDLYGRAKTLQEQVAGGLSIIGSVGSEGLPADAGSIILRNVIPDTA
jgi:hypothetical protein